MARFHWCVYGMRRFSCMPIKVAQRTAQSRRRGEADAGDAREKSIPILCVADYELRIDRHSTHVLRIGGAVEESVAGAQHQLLVRGGTPGQTEARREIEPVRRGQAARRAVLPGQNDRY